MSRFFIDRPIFAWVIAIIIMLSGCSRSASLPVAQFPAIAPPQISDHRDLSRRRRDDAREDRHPDHRAAAEGHRRPALFLVPVVVAGTVADHPHLRPGHRPRHRPGAGPEQGPAGAAAAAAGGPAAGRPGQQVLGQLPDRPGSLFGRQPHDQDDLADMLASNIQDPVSRINGVGDVKVFGSQYAMRIWLDPSKLNSYQLTMADVIIGRPGAERAGLGGPDRRPAARPRPAAQRDRHRPVAAADARAVPRHPCSRRSRRLGRAPAATSRASSSAPRTTRVQRDYNGHPGAGIGDPLAPGANALKTIGEVQGARSPSSPSTFPPGRRRSSIPYDTTPFVKLSIRRW